MIDGGPTSQKGPTPDIALSKGAGTDTPVFRAGGLGFFPTGPTTPASLNKKRWFPCRLEHQRGSDTL